MDSNIYQQLEKLRQEAQTRLDERIQEAEQEVQLYQTELEIQHEELRRSHHELNTLYEEYWYLYHFAPCAYITLNHNHIITRVNQQAAALLQSQDSPLNHLAFSRFIAPEHQDLFLRTLDKAEQTTKTQQLKLQLIAGHEDLVWVCLQIRPHFTYSQKVTQWQITFTESSHE